MELKLKRKDRLFLVMKICMDIAAYLFVGLIVFYVLFIVAKGISVISINDYGIKPDELLNFADSLIAGALGVVGGLLAARAQSNWSKDMQVKRLENYIKSILLAEVKLNNQHFANCWGRGDIVSDMDKSFKLTDWEKIKNEIYLLNNEKQYAEVINSICELYSWLERANHIADLKIKVDKSSMINLKGKISNSLCKAMENIPKMQ